MKDEDILNVYLSNQSNPCFTLLYRRYSRKVFAKCISMLHDETKANDATQEIFLKLFLSLSKFNHKSRFSTWLYSITYNYCIDYIRKQKRHGAIFSDEMERAPDEAVPEVSDAEMEAIKTKVLNKVLDDIPPGDKAILLMKYREGMSIKEIATGLDKTESAVKMKIKRAKAKAQEARKKYDRENDINYEGFREFQGA